MPTIEERLNTLEKAQSDTNHNITVLVGVIGEQGRDIKRIAATLEQQTALLAQHSDLLTQHTTLLTQHTSLLQQILAKLP